MIDPQPHPFWGAALMHPAVKGHPRMPIGTVKWFNEQHERGPATKREARFVAELIAKCFCFATDFCDSPRPCDPCAGDRCRKTCRLCGNSTLRRIHDVQANGSWLCRAGPLLMPGRGGLRVGSRSPCCC